MDYVAKRRVLWGTSALCLQIASSSCGGRVTTVAEGSGGSAGVDAPVGQGGILGSASTAVSAGGFVSSSTGGVVDIGLGDAPEPSEQTCPKPQDVHVMFPEAGTPDAGRTAVSAFPCWVILSFPPPPYHFDPQRVNVAITTATGTSIIPSAPAFGACAMVETSSALAWYYDDPTQPTRIDFCPMTCASLLRDGGAVSVHYGCGRLPPPI